MVIAQVLGSDDLLAYLDKYEIELDPHFDDLLEQFPRQPWSSFVNEQNAKWVNPEALEFLEGLLKYDHQERLTPREAMKLAYFDPVRASVMQQS